MTGHDPRRIAPFGYLRVNGYLHLSAAFRSLSRPSSADIAKASTVCSYYLNLIRLRIADFSAFLTVFHLSFDFSLLSSFLQCVRNFSREIFLTFFLLCSFQRTVESFLVLSKLSSQLCRCRPDSFSAFLREMSP